MAQRSTKPQVTRNPFALPRGSLGRLAGRLMARTNMAAQHEVAARLRVAPGDRVLEIGYGPGVLLRHLLDTTQARLVAGVDPSGVMLEQAREATRPYVRSGRLDLRLGDGADLPFADGSFEHVVAVNTVAIWPDLDAALAEVRRVLTGGGTVLAAWHSPTSPRRVQRRLALGRERAEEVEHALAAAFGGVERENLGHVEVFLAHRPHTVPG